MLHLPIFVGVSVVLFELFGLGVVGIGQNNSSDMPNVTVLRWNTRFENADSLSLTSIAGISPEQCKWECTLRTGCKAVEYKISAKRCRLYTAISAIVISPGSVTVSGFDTAMQCGNRTCGPNEACDTLTDMCKVKECGYPDGEYTVMGNRFELGSVVLAHMNGGGTVKQVRCTDGGEWKSMRELWTVHQGITCRDIRQKYPTIHTGAYVNQLNMTIYCDFDTDGGAWLVFQRRMDGSVDFYRNWEDYKLGFGDMRGEFWLGLENLHTILRSSSPAQFELRIDLEDWNGNTRYAEYASFDLSDESDGYRLHSVDYTGTAGDALHLSKQSSNGQMFTTRDRDSDGKNGSNCAEDFRGAWWYRSCHAANLNGMYYVGGPVTVYASGMSWYPWKKLNYSMKKTAMMIRERSDA